MGLDRIEWRGQDRRVIRWDKWMGWDRMDG